MSSGTRDGKGSGELKKAISRNTEEKQSFSDVQLTSIPRRRRTEKEEFVNQVRLGNPANMNVLT